MKLLSAIFFSLMCQMTTAQSTVRLNIVDIKNQPVIGATVLEVGTRNGAYTDINGNAVLTVSDENDIIRVSLLHFETLEVKAKDLSEYIILKYSDKYNEFMNKKPK
jgi:hypothetical protein